MIQKRYNWRANQPLFRSLLLQLGEANDIVNEEIHRLDHNADAAFETVNARFQAVIESVEKRRQEVLEEVRQKRDEKKKVLDEQLQIIQAEKEKVDQDVRVGN